MLVGTSSQHLRLLNRKATVKEAVKEVRFAASVSYPRWDNDTIKFVGQLGAKEGLFSGRSEHTPAKWCQVVSQWDSYCMLQLDLEKTCYQYTKALKVDFFFKWRLSPFFFFSPQGSSLPYDYSARYTVFQHLWHMVSFNRQECFVFFSPLFFSALFLILFCFVVNLKK